MGYQNIDKEKLEELLPKGVHHKVTDEMISTINRMEEDTGLLQDYMEESLLTHLPVLREVKVSIGDYINAIKYCNLKRNMDNQKAWEITFPERFKKLETEGRLNSSHSSMYNQSPLVLKIDAQMQLAISIQYAPMFHKMMMKEFELASGWDAHGRETSAMVQHLAASKIIDVAAPPEDSTLNIKIGPSEESKSLQQKTLDKMAEIAKNQQALIASGASVEEVQKLNLTIEVEVEDDEEYIEV